MLRRQQSSRFCDRPHGGLGRAGISFIELMVVISMLSMVAMALINLVAHSSAMVAKGAATMELNQKARTAVDRLSPYLLTASSDAGALALKSPNIKVDAPTAADLLSYKSIRFTTTEDFLAPNYAARDPWSPTHTRYYYEIYFDDETSPKDYVTEDGTHIKLGQIRLQRYVDPQFAVKDTAVSSIPLAHNIRLFRCHMLTSRSLEVIVHTVGKRKAPHSGLLDSFEEARGIVNTPAPFYQ